MQANETRRVELNVNAAGHGSVIVDGIDMSDVVRAVTVDSRVGEVTTVTLEICKERVTAEIDAVVVSSAAGRADDVAEVLRECAAFSTHTSTDAVAAAIIEALT